MNTQRITISLPTFLYKQITERVKSGEVSHFVTKAIEDKLLCMPKSPQEAVEDFLSLREKLPKLTRSEIKLAIEKGRL